MLPKEELKQRNTEFWASFKDTMKGQKSSKGYRLNWIKYPTEVKDIYLRMETDGKGTRLCLDIQPKDDGIREIIWEQMTELKKVMDDEMGMEAMWNEDSHYIGDRKVSRISWSNSDLNFFHDEDLPLINAFFKDKLIRFDNFYQEFKEILINLTS